MAMAVQKFAANFGKRIGLSKKEPGSRGSKPPFELSDAQSLATVNTGKKNHKQQTNGKGQQSDLMAKQWEYINESASLGLYDNNLEKNEVYYSNGYLQNLGHGPEEWSNSPREWSQRIHPEDKSKVLEETNKLWDKEKNAIDINYRMRHKDGTYRWIHDQGKIVEWNPQGKPTRMIGTHQDISPSKQNEEGLKLLANTDSLTGLANRTTAFENIRRIKNQLRRTGTRSALLFCDLDNFKLINDTYSHRAGDEVLCAVAKRIKACLRTGDLAARIGGDELLVLLQGVQDEANAQGLAHKLREAVAKPIHTTGGLITTSMSIGLTLVRDEESVDELVDRADAAMYEAKRNGRNQVNCR
jgi:diguanylate cyclase (GGDEF)-like protein/PAS domain S-box-containing protein